jgi:MoxR-like ATPase
MTETQTKKTTTAADEEKDFVTRLADAGEEALHRLTELPGGQRAMNAMNDLRARVDDLAKKVRGIDALEERVSKLEQDVTELRKAKTSSRSTSSKTS